MGSCISSKWLKATNCKIPYLKLLLFFQNTRNKNYRKNCYLNNFLFLLSVEKQWANLASSYVIRLQYCIQVEVGHLNTFFKIPIIFSHWLSESYKTKRKTRFHITYIYFSKSDYVILNTVMNIMTKNSA